MNGPTNDRPTDGGPIGPKLLGRLLDEHGPALALYAGQWTDAADDCVQEALVELARQATRPENLRAWLFRVVKHRALNMARSDRRRREREDRAAESRFVALRRQSGDAFDELEISEALDSLDAVEREVIVMRIWGGMTFAEIAAALKSSTSNVHRRYQHGLEALRQKLETPCPANENQATGRCQPN
jgi:RNA polymerase sigma factor (sigma-70 family)